VPHHDFGTEAPSAIGPYKRATEASTAKLCSRAQGCWRIWPTVPTLMPQTSV
jgi:hypothetical protein